ncbi:hypothetical protein H6P81_016485 [Aristolochia fimbriata]|uniref:Uncharacterized protein n=1 Tax=Aristolochia fimbriata TaxID=158543 RepID=A0AAV7E8F8_ARIFI|nr:hypothetical protein H6P81_016485 [Aristolochia fimbriata]
MVPYSEVFVTKDAEKKYAILTKKKFRGELAIATKEFKIVLPLLEKLQFKGTIFNFKSYSEEVVLEFYSNLEMLKNDIGNHIYVRGHWYAFDSNIVSEYLHLPVYAEELEEEEDVVTLQELTGGKLSVWPNSYSIPASSLIPKYAALHKITVWDWLPSTHRGSLSKRLVDFVYRAGTEQQFNVGVKIFEHILQGPKSGEQGHIVFPSLIFGILEKQSVIVSFGVSITTHVLPVTEAVPDTVLDAPTDPASSALGGLRFLSEFTALGESSSSMAPPPWPWSPTISLDDKLLDFLRKRGEIAQKEVVQYEKLARLKRHEVALIDHLLKEFGHVIEKARASVKFVKSSIAREQLFGEVINQVRGPHMLVSLDVPTRWNSTYIMLNTTLELKDAFMSCCYVPFMVSMASIMMEKFKKYWNIVSTLLAIVVVVDPKL